MDKEKKLDKILDILKNTEITSYNGLKKVNIDMLMEKYSYEVENYEELTEYWKNLYIKQNYKIKVKLLKFIILLLKKEDLYICSKSFKIYPRNQCSECFKLFCLCSSCVYNINSCDFCGKDICNTCHKYTWCGEKCKYEIYHCERCHWHDKCSKYIYIDESTDELYLIN